MPKHVTILFIGDIVGEEGLGVVRSFLPSLIQKHKADFVIANGENTHEGHGINAVSYTHLRCRRSTLCRSRWSPYH